MSGGSPVYTELSTVTTRDVIKVLRVSLQLCENWASPYTSHASHSTSPVPDSTRQAPLQFRSCLRWR